MNEQLLKFQTLEVNRLFKTTKKSYGGRGGGGENGMASTPSLPRLGVRGLKTIISLSENK